MSTETRPTAIEPSRVMLLDEQEQKTLLDALMALDDEEQGVNPTADRLYERIEGGDTYANPTDEYVCKTLAKRRLEAEIRKLNARITDLDAQLVEEWADVGRSKDGHAATGATLSLNRRVYAKLDVDTDGLPKTAADQIRAQHKARVGQMLIDIGLDSFVRPDFNLNTLSAFFAEEIKEYDEQQRMLPEHERVPKAPADFLPEELRGLLVIDATPHIQIRA